MVNKAEPRKLCKKQWGTERKGARREEKEFRRYRGMVEGVEELSRRGRGVGQEWMEGLRFGRQGINV